MPEVYDLAKMLEEIIEDEKVSTPRNRKVSQEEIKKILLEKRRRALQAEDSSQIPLGRALIKAGLITPEQLQEALEYQSRKGGKIGAVLVEMGCVSDEDLLTLLSKKYGIQSVSLLDAEIGEDLMSLLPLRIYQQYKVLPLRIEGRTLHLAMENPTNFAAIHEVEFLTGKVVHPVITSSLQMDLAVHYIETKKGKAFSGLEIQQALRGPMTIPALLEHLVKSRGSDLFITSGAPPSIKICGALLGTDMPAVTAKQCLAYAKALMSEAQWENFEREKQLVFASEYQEIGRFRVSIYSQRQTVSLAIRRIPEAVPAMEELGLPQWLETFALKPQGLILVAGPTGHGKTTTASALIDFINTRKTCNIVTLEDPMEMIHKPRKSSVNQREIGMDTASFSEGLKGIERQGADVVMVGELSEPEAIENAIRAACNGHLVLGIVAAPSVRYAIAGTTDCFPHHRQEQIRQQLSQCLLLVFVQILLPGVENDSLVLAYETLINSSRVKNYIRDDQLMLITTQAQTEANDFISLDACLKRLVEDGKVPLSAALAVADNAEVVAGAGFRMEAG